METVPTLVPLSKFQHNVLANCQCLPDQALGLRLDDSEHGNAETSSDIILHSKAIVSRRYNVKNF